MQLEQQESFTIQGPQLEVFGQIESKLPTPAKKKPVALAVIALMAVLSVFGIGGARMRAAYNAVQAQYTATNEYNQGIQPDFATQADAAASMIRLAGRVLGEDDADVVAAADALGAWNANTDITAGAQYPLNVRLYSAVDTLYTAASDEAGSKEKGQLTDLHDAFVSAQNTIDRQAAAYNDSVAAYNRQTAGFPASIIGPLWGASDPRPFGAP